MPIIQSYSPTPSYPSDEGTPSPSAAKPTATASKRGSNKRSAAGDTPTTPKTKSRKVSPTTHKSAAKTSASQGTPSASTKVVDWRTVEGMTPQKEEAIMDYLIGHAVSTTGNTALAKMFNVTSTTMSNALQVGRPSNLRAKAIKAVRGD